MEKRIPFREGDIVSINKAGFSEEHFTPLLLIQRNNAPNRFTVDRVGMWDPETEAVILKECCGVYFELFCVACEEIFDFIDDVEEGTAPACLKCGSSSNLKERPKCIAHRVELFDLVGHCADERRQQRTEEPVGELEVMTPFGKILQISHFKGELIAKTILGTVGVRGPVADVLGDLFRKHKII